MRIGVTIGRREQVIIGAYLVLVIIWLLWRIDDTLGRMEANQHRQDRRVSRQHVDPVGVRDETDGEDPMDELMNEIEEEPE